MSENLDKTIIDETAQEESVENLLEKIDVDALDEIEAKAMLKEVLQSNEEIIAELNTAQVDSEKFKDNWYRTTAEFENFKRRNQDTRKTAYLDGKIDAIKSLLIIGDSVDRALSLPLDDNAKNGIELIAKQFNETMKSLGVEEINPVGEMFSPDEAEAIALVEKAENEESGTIRSVFKKGYKTNGKIIRFAQVITVK